MTKSSQGETAWSRIPKRVVSALRIYAVALVVGQVSDAFGQPRAEPAEEASSGWRADVFLLEEYRLRTAVQPPPASAGLLGERPGARRMTDHDLRFMIDGQISGKGEHVLGLASAELWWDVAGAPPRGTPDLFARQWDYAQSWWAVYLLSVEWRNAGALDYLRLGRQTSEHGLPLTFDGAAVEVSPVGKQLSFFGFGGQTVHFFESEPGLLENWVGSVGVGVRPNKSWHWEVDGRWVQDTALDQDKQPSRIRNMSYGLAASVREEEFSSKVFVRGIDQQVSLAGGSLLSSFPSLGMGIDLRGVVQPVTLGEVNESENPYFSLLGPSLPHARLKAEVWKEIGFGDPSRLTLHLGWRVRQLLSGQEGPFNRNVGGVYLQTELSDIGTKGLHVGGIAEWTYRAGSARNDSMLAVGGSTGYTQGILRTELGTYFQRFKIQYYRIANELQDTRTAFAMVGVRALPWLEVRGRYEVELLDRYIQTAVVSLRQNL